MKKLILLFLCATAVTVSFAFSQTVAEPHYVVLDDALAEIERLQADNEAMSGINATLQGQNDQLEIEIAESRDFVIRLDEMIAKIVTAKGPIYTALQTVTDQGTKRELQNKMDDLRESEYQLEKTRRQEFESIRASNDLIETNRRMIAVNNVRSSSNEQRIEYLRACYEYTRDENRGVEDLLSDADALRQEAEALMSRR